MRVRIELTDRFVFVKDEATRSIQIKSRPVAEVTLSDPAEKTTRSYTAGEDIIKRRKPDVNWTGESFPDILRNIAAWIEAKDDPSLKQFVEEAEAQRKKRDAESEAGAPA